MSSIANYSIVNTKIPLILSKFNFQAEKKSCVIKAVLMMQHRILGKSITAVSQILYSAIQLVLFSFATRYRGSKCEGDILSPQSRQHVSAFSLLRESDKAPQCHSQNTKQE